MQAAPGVDRATEMFHLKLIDIYNETCLIKKTETLSGKDQIIHAVKIILKNKQRYFSLYRRNLISNQHYTNFRNFVTSQIMSAKKQYYQKVVINVKNNSKNM